MPSTDKVTTTSHDYIMPNGKLLTECTYGEVETFTIGELKEIASLMFWSALMACEDDEVDDEADFIEDGESPTDDVAFVTEEELAERDAKIH